jgi:N-acyl-D-amino-acid deacylase
MKVSIAICFTAAISFLLSACSPQELPFLPEYPKIDLMIINGQVLDGLGNEAINADVVIVGDTIVFVGETKFSAQERQSRIGRTIDAMNSVVSPGFIDLHSHGNPLETPTFENFLAMGVTTISLGQDGDSPEIEDLGSWLETVAEKGIGPNLAMFVGHGTLRSITGIGRDAKPDDATLQTMLALLDNTLEYTFGLSSGLEYNPGLNAPTSELEAIAKVVGQNDRLIMSHMRNEDDDKLDASIAELIEQGKHARVHIAHLKSVYGKGAERGEEILRIIKNARDGGVQISADTYPYNASYTGIDIVFPIWAKAAEQFQIAKQDRRAELETFLVNKVTRRNGPEATLLGTPPYTGKTLADIARELEMPFEHVLIDEIGPQGASGAYFVMNDQLQSAIIADPNISICSDGSPTGFHPRGHGTFAKIIELYVMDRQVLSLKDAVRKMTSLPAQTLQLHDRGVIGKGMKADLIIFDPAKVKETATYPNPHQFAEGFDLVIINGKITREDGEMFNTTAGVVLKPQPSKTTVL